MKGLGSRINKVLHNSGLSKKDFASKLDISEQAVGNYTSERRVPKAEILLKLKQTFNVSIDWLLDGDDEELQKVNSSYIPNEPTNDYLTPKDHIRVQNDLIESLKNEKSHLKEENARLKKELESIIDNRSTTYKH